MSIAFGIIGCGGIANRFARVLNKVPDATLGAVASQTAAKAQEFAQIHGAGKAFGSYEELVCQADLDVVYVANTHNFHYDCVMMCLEHGKAVICEKPLVLTHKEASEIFKKAEEQDLLVMEAMWTRCLPSYLKAKEWLQQDEIGRPAMIQATFSFTPTFNPQHRLFNPELAGGSLYDTGVYPIELAIGLAGESPSEVTGVCVRGQTGVDESVSMSLKFPSGVLAMLGCGFRARVSGDAWIYGDKGSIVIRQYLGSTKCECFDENRELKDVFEEPCEDGFIYQIEHFCELFRAGKKISPLIPPKDTLACAYVFDELMSQWGDGGASTSDL